MRLKSLQYTAHEGAAEEWRLRGLTLQDVNLLVGRNASGKSRILNVLYHLVRALTSRQNLSYGHCWLTFDHQGMEIQYELDMRGGKIVREVFMIDCETHLERGCGGKGTIFAVKESRQIEFQTPETQLAVVARRDTIQHPYFEPLHQWAESLYYYAFGTSLGQEKLFFFVVSNDEESKIDLKDPSQVVAIFRKGEQEFGQRFTSAVKDDFGAIGYEIEEVGLSQPHNIRVKRPILSALYGIYVKEADLSGMTDQYVMSQGMFRALSIIVQINYAVLADTPSCILIDDIGEGLDFERSCSLIDVLNAKAANSSVQLLMATNDRFVMNRVPLEVWSIVDRQGGHVNIRNYANSKDLFDKFKFTGLNNFDFFALDYLHASAADA
ncbi:AAA family ATPase [Candidatus Entotheonella palauensis]|uniref:ATPase AAA-type core domain-containing protein n=1 Tax=Candidatus Entotheonella gemina TaxID=1429439 RepID=W4M911_9BACT|nr:AAA family ATPase [Candidatus Entotheonella palauensis]ETX06829.1 MAG: hypothetical protein ETSY2_14770 [Candidatus Entotheonella gemina]